MNQNKKKKQEIDGINRSPTYKQKLAAIEDYDKKYSWKGKGYWPASGRGKTLWKALLDDSSRCSSQHSSIFDQWAEERADADMKDKDFREEYMPQDLWGVYVIIGNKDRKIDVGQVHAKNQKDALKSTRPEIQAAGAEFAGIPYKLVAEKEAPDMTEKQFEQMCYDRAYEDTNDIENMIDDINNDQDVADFFGIEYEIEEFEHDEWGTKELGAILAICSCAHPLFKEDFDNVERDDETGEITKPPECWYCGEDLRTYQEKVVDAI